ncbi:MAG: M1 family aminopeptidase [candidate division WOR-3 bacterium]
MSRSAAPGERSGKMKMFIVLLTFLPVIILAQPVFEPPVCGVGGKPKGSRFATCRGRVPYFEVNPFTFAESLHSYDVRHYRLDFELPMDNAGYSCRERVVIKSNVPSLDTFSIDFANLVCDSVKCDDDLLTFTNSSEQLNIKLDTPLPLGDSTTIDIFFHREPTAPQIGYFFAQSPGIKHSHAMTCGCPRDNHYWFACWDWPNDKAERGCEINITLPDTFQACANGVLDSVTDAPGGKKTWWWRHSYPICTYLMTFSASRFARWDTIVTCSDGDTVPLIYFMWPEDSAKTRNGYRYVPDMMLYYSDTSRFGPYPFERFGMVPGYYGFPWGGMEHQTQVMIHTNFIGGGGEATICHELSHMWWGDMVTHISYADVWLNEGFASWAECLYMGHLNGRNYFQQYIVSKANQYFSQHRSKDFPIYNPPWNEIYNYGIIYCKGSWILRMLQFLTGDTAWEKPGIFFKALRTYGDSFKYGTVSTEDFQRITEQVTGIDLDTFFNEWIYDRGYPKFWLNWTTAPFYDSWQVFIRLVQHNDTNSRAFFRSVPLPIRFNCPGESITVVLFPQDTVYYDTFLLDRWPMSITPDPDNWILDSCTVTSIGIEEMNCFLPVHISTIKPNPATGAVIFQLSEKLERPVQIYDRSGRLVKELLANSSQLIWQRTDAKGKRVPAGVYFVRIAGNSETIEKIVLIE